MNEIETLKVNNLNIRIVNDEDPQDPREDDNVATFAFFHNRYSLGDKNVGFTAEDFSGWDEMAKHIIKTFKPVCIKPVCLYDHSGITIRTSGFSDIDSMRWDWGQIGFAFVTREKALKEYGTKSNRITPAIKKQCEKMLDAEIETYDQYLTGQVYGYIVETDSGEQVDSCFGMFGLDYTKQEAISVAQNQGVPA